LEYGILIFGILILAKFRRVVRGVQVGLERFHKFEKKMLLYFTLLVISGLVTLVGVVSIIYGLIKKRINFRSTGLFVFMIGLFGCFIFGYQYAKNTIDYVKSNDFQEDAKSSAQFVGETVGTVTSGLSKGLSKTLDDEAISKLAQKSGAILGKSIKTIASALDSTIGSKSIFIDKTLERDGLTFGRAEEKFNAESNDLGIFVASETDFKGRLKITNYDQTGKKIDVAEKEVNIRAGKGNVEVFSFTNADFGMTTYFIITKISG
jgi:hypothetical protein